MSTELSTTERPHTIEAFLAQQTRQDLLRFITCGSVDDGKSTLIGRLLWDAQQLFDDQLAALQAESKRYGTQGEDIDFALLVDGLGAEREQGITIDVAYRFFATSRRKFIVADTPGHEQYTRNMVTGASTAQVAVLLVDARHGLMVQTRRHAYLCALTGIRHVVLAVNKMDLMGYDARVFDAIEQAFAAFAQPLSFASVTAIPVSALKGDNITQRSAAMPWYAGATLMGYLETVQVEREAAQPTAAFPVQWVNRPNAHFRGFSGCLVQGQLHVGDTLRVTRSGQEATLKSIVTMDGDVSQATAGDAVTLVLGQEIDVSRGDVLSLAEQPLNMSDMFGVTLVWMHEDAGWPGRTYDLKFGNQWVTGAITRIKHRVNVNTLTKEPATQLGLNDIGECQLSLNRAVVFGPYASMPALGNFIVVDRMTRATVAAGMVRYNLRRAQNVHAQALTIGRADRERLNAHPAKVVWFTGLSGSGKSTIANALEVALHARGVRTMTLDGDNVRKGLNKDLGFTEVDRVENIRRVAEVATLMRDAGLVVLTAFISPFRAERELAKTLVGEADFVEVFVDASLEVCERRDVKGLYRKARNGEIPNFTGISSAYEAPLQPDVVLDTNAITIDEAVTRLIQSLNLAP